MSREIARAMVRVGADVADACASVSTPKTIAAPSRCSGAHSVGAAVIVVVVAFAAAACSVGSDCKGIAGRGRVEAEPGERCSVEHSREGEPLTSSAVSILEVRDDADTARHSCPSEIKNNANTHNFKYNK